MSKNLLFLSLLAIQIYSAKAQDACLITIDTVKSAFDPWERYIINIPEFHDSLDGKILKIGLDKYTGTHFISLSIKHSSVDIYDFIFLVIEYENGQSDTLYQNNIMSLVNSFDVIYSSKGFYVNLGYRNPFSKVSAPLSSLVKPWKSLRLEQSNGYTNEVLVNFIFTSQETLCMNRAIETIITFLDE